MSKAPQSRPHLYEIDLIRGVTVFSVVAVHSLSYTMNLTRGSVGIDIVNFISHALHYNREMFMFVTGLVLTYVYYRRDFSVSKFLFKRFSFVFIPYVLWSIIYSYINHPSLTLPSFLHTSLWNIFTGEASFQLYYILLALQFYLIFPLFLLLLKKVIHHPWWTLAISFALQLILIFLDYHYLQQGQLHRNHAIERFVHYQDRFFFMYQFFFILGGVVGVCIAPVQSFLKHYGSYLLGIFLLSLGLYGGFYYLQIHQYHVSLSLATSVLQPSVVLYSTVIIACMFRIAQQWAAHRKAYGLVKIISETSFGIYFVHVIFLGLLTQYLLPVMKPLFPVPVIDISMIILAFCLSVGFCYLLFVVPFLSWTIGKFRPILH